MKLILRLFYDIHREQAFFNQKKCKFFMIEKTMNCRSGSDHRIHIYPMINLYRNIIEKF